MKLLLIGRSVLVPCSLVRPCGLRRLVCRQRDETHGRVISAKSGWRSKPLEEFAPQAAGDTLYVDTKHALQRQSVHHRGGMNTFDTVYGRVSAARASFNHTAGTLTVDQ